MRLANLLAAFAVSTIICITPGAAKDASGGSARKDTFSLEDITKGYFETTDKEEKGEGNAVAEEAQQIFGSFQEKDMLPPAPHDLRYAFIIFRHGIRSPVLSPFQSISDYVKMWGLGIGGTLTTKGKRLMIHVGESLATRYNRLIPRFDDDVVKFTSSFVKRAKVSAQCVATGLFTQDDPIFRGKNVRQLLPCKPLSALTTASFDKCSLFVDVIGYNPCKTYTKLRKQSQRREKEQISSVRSEYYSKLNHCIHDAFKKRNFANSLYDSHKAFDTFQAWVLDERRYLEGCLEHAMPVMKKTVQLHYWHEIYSKDNMVQYYIGPLINTILNEMEEALGGEKTANDPTAPILERKPSRNGGKLRMHFHGSHDVTVCPFFWVLSSEETYYALTGDTVVLEMTSHGRVQLFLYSPLEVDKTKTFRHVSMKPVCGRDDCTLDDLKTAMKPFSYGEDTWKKACSDDSKLRGEFRPLPHDVDHDDIKLLDRGLSTIDKSKSLTPQSSGLLERTISILRRSKSSQRSP